METLLLTPANQILFEHKQHILSLLERCSNMKEAKQIHGHMFKTGVILDTIAESRLLNFCALSTSGNLTYARKIFDRIQSPNTFKWNMMVRCYANEKNLEQSFLLYRQMLSNSVQHNAYTFPFILKVCAELSVMEETQQIHSHILKSGFSSDIYSANSLLHAYAKCGCVISASRVFDRMMEKDSVSWNSMIDAYVKHGEIETAREIFNQMTVKKNVISWTTVIAGCVAGGLFKEAVNLFHEMQIERVEADRTVLASTLAACAHLGALEQGRWIHAYIDKNRIKIDQVLGCSLVDMYAKCGELEEAIEVFRNMKDKGVHTWTAMIAGFGVHGRGREALQLFEEMQKAGVRPNSMTLTSVLTACSHAGLVKDGASIFEGMERIHKITPTIEHYGCMVSLLGRAGLLDRAEELINTMPMKPNAAVLGALLSASCIHRNPDIGKRIGKLLIEMDNNHGGRYVHLATIFATEGEWEQAAKIRKTMEDRGVRKSPGTSSIELHGVVHDFCAYGTSHPQMSEIHRTWEQISTKLTKVGYVPKTRNLLLDLEEEEKESAIHWHSEKLAITFGLINSEPGEKIRVVKNLRVCEDCHTVTKFISRIYTREIVMRDRTRFHHFRDGKCSCGDYW